MYQFISPFVLIALVRTTAVLAEGSGTNYPLPPPITIPPVEKANITNSSTIGVKIIPLYCNQAFMPLQDENATLTENQKGPANITECACKAYDTPSGAFCATSSCKNFATCQQCNLITLGVSAKTSNSNNLTIPSVECRNNYFLPSPKDRDQHALCTDVEDHAFACEGPCTGGTYCQECISMDDPYL
ncbi:uncharacterized protein MELLADRAFT_101424 [Melampsora larici-populina 98AG31]|uniref:Secreted protein n=1 Tax=Melampsora larici-populina (strain 98AG31 / pathotype 3-4-7) TaxID=747676 RepID=F4R4P8_MELLP|nr:uncharacterized protein MELLADRAFT_101424 [Melampsora larici-populina 98AG31]EGG12846.1 secreted protein [Melampsora larici-populina 98AG31]